MELNYEDQKGEQIDKEINEKMEEKRKKTEALRTFSTIGLAFFAIIIVVDIIQILMEVVVVRMFGETAKSSQFYSLIQMGVLYFIGVPIGVMIIKKLPKNEIQKNKIGFAQMFTFFLIAQSFMYIGNLISRILIVIMGMVWDRQFLNPVEGFLRGNSMYLTIFIVVIMAPLVEEFLCRKLVIDRLIKYGEWVAIFTSAALFGLFHMNLFQFFYAYFLGLLLGYIYVKTGRILYTIILHMIVNFISGVIALYMTELINFDGTADLTAIDVSQLTPTQQGHLIIFAVYGLCLFLLAVVGTIIYIMNRKRIVLLEGKCPLPKRERYRIIFFNPGMILMVSLSVIATVLGLMLSF